MAIEDRVTASVSVGARQADEIVARIERLPFTKLHARTCGLISLGHFFDAFDLLILASALTVVVTSLHLSYVEVGILLSSTFVGATAGSLIFGWVSEIVGRRPAIIWAVGLFGVLSIGMAFAWDFNGLLVMRIVQGIGLGGMQPVATALYNEFLAAKARGKAYFFGMSLSFSLGIFLAPLAGYACLGLLGEDLGWRTLFLLGSVALPIAVAMHYLLPESPRWLVDKGRIDEADSIVTRLEDSARRGGMTLSEPVIRLRADQQPTRFGELFQGIYRVRTILVWAQFFCTYFINYGFGLWLPTLYVKIGGLPPSEAVGLAVVFGAINVVKTIIFGFIVDWFGRKWGLIFGYSLCIFGVALGVVAIAGLHMSGWPVLLTVYVITGVGGYFNGSLCYLYAVELFPTRMRSWATATGSASNRIGAFVAPTAIGFLLSTDLGVVGVFVMLGIVALIGLIFVAILGPETSGRALEETSV